MSAAHVLDSQIGLLRGRWQPRSEMRLDIDDLGFRQAATAVERLRTYAGSVFELDAHLDRWEQTVNTIGIGGLPLRPAIKVLIDELIRRNRTFVDAAGDFGITLFATPGTRSDSVPTFGMHLNPIDHVGVRKRRRQGQTLIVTEIAQPPSTCWPREIKVRCRLHYYLADQLANRRHRGALGVLRDQDMTVTETSVANLAIVEGSTVVAPPRTRVLDGITQQVVRDLAAESSILWRESPITVERLHRADEVLLMGTDTGLWFARRVDSRPIGSGKPGPLYLRLRQQFDLRTGTSHSCRPSSPDRDSSR